MKKSFTINDVVFVSGKLISVTVQSFLTAKSNVSGTNLDYYAIRAHFPKGEIYDLSLNDKKKIFKALELEETGIKIDEKIYHNLINFQHPANYDTLKDNAITWLKIHSEKTIIKNISNTFVPSDKEGVPDDKHLKAF